MAAGTIMYKNHAYGGGSGSGGSGDNIVLTQAEYDALTYEEKHDPDKYYYISDASQEGSSGHIIVNENNVQMTSRDKLKFIGGVLEDDSVNNSTNVYLWNAPVVITTTSSTLFGETVSVKKNGTLVGTTQFNSQGLAEFVVHFIGTYSFEALEGTVTTELTVSEEKEYQIQMQDGLDLASWISAGSTTGYPLNPSSYADFSALEADEAAVRQLMLVHDAVDYLATATAGDSLMQSVINSDVCAKWINLSDYALDTLYANSDIADVMDTADKYGYGEWGIIDSTTTPPTWGALGNVPIMTANNAPYGVASAYQVFDGNSGTSASGTDFSYQSVNPICVKKFECSVNGGTLQGSNDGSTYTDISDPSSNTTYYMYHRVHFASSQTVHTLQFYGRELTPLVPTMTGNTTPKGECIESGHEINHPAYMAFTSDGWYSNASTNPTNDPIWVGYTFDIPGIVKGFRLYDGYATDTWYLKNFVIEGSDDGFTSDIHTLYTSATKGASVTEVKDVIANSTPYESIRIRCTEFNGPVSSQASSFYGKYLANLKNINFYGYDYSEKEFAPGSTRKTIYDHGVELVTLTDASGSGCSITKYSDYILGNDPSSTTTFVAQTPSIDLSSYHTLNEKMGHIGTGSFKSTNIYLVTAGAYASLSNPPTASLDISSVSGSDVIQWLGTSASTTGTCSLVELWLE